MKEQEEGGHHETGGKDKKEQEKELENKQVARAIWHTNVTKSGIYNFDFLSDACWLAIFLFNPYAKIISEKTTLSH